ncbi:MAG: 50S ribosomal protein L29 [Candidatus Marinimicrobia bacterium]|nr:50S ribosomal protein L29 [Candidatus Neomarinimicrobiota bacterium]|tara:strand:- start:473 stop:679 length:207 start_codon:yes stop_codon:yes gene_type:complete
MAKKKNINDMGIDELRVELKNLNDSLFNFNFQKALQQLEHPQKLRHVKKDIARVKTFIKQYELGIKNG